MFKKYSILLFILLVSIKSVNAGTSDIIILCNDCSYSKVEQSVSLEYERSKKKNYLVKDIVKGKIYAYNMWYEPEIGESILTPTGVSSIEKAKFLTISAEYDTIRHLLMQPYISGVSFTAYDAQQYEFLEQDIINDFKNNASAVRKLDTILTSLISGANVGVVAVGFNWEFEIILPGNTIATVYLSGFKNGNGEAVFKIKEYRDSDGNLIPEPDLTNTRLTFRFSTIENYLTWAAYMQDVYNLDSSEIVISWVNERYPDPIITIVDFPISGDPDVTQPPPKEDDEGEPREQEP